MFLWKYFEKYSKKIVLVYLEDKKIFGSSSATRKQGKRSHVWEIDYQVKKEYREKGIGSALLLKSLVLGKQEGSEWNKI